MFESDEWDIDEDYMKDLNTDDACDCFNNEQENKIGRSGSEDETKKIKDSTCANTTSKQNAVLDIFRNTHNIETNKPLKNSMINSPNDYKKNLVLNVFQNNERVVLQKNRTKQASANNSRLRLSEENLQIDHQTYESNENGLKRKKNVAFSESAKDSKSVKKYCASVSNTFFNETKKSTLIQNCDILSRNAKINLTKKNHANNDIKPISTEQTLNLHTHKITKMTRTRAPQAVTRKFPGPAGLLPDDINEAEIINLETIDENKHNKTNKYVDICSQNTKNLFSSGAWQLMTDDLPSDFELYDIATIKENALEYSKAYKKIPYLAGIIQYIDYKPNDPQVILKDLTGKIDACIHHSVCKLYPNALGTQIVVLVKDVGLIVTSKKYVCLIISLKNLVSLYSDDARLVETPHLEKLLDRNYKCNINESQISLFIEDNNKENGHEQNGKIYSNNSNVLKQQSKTNNQLDNLQNVVSDKCDSMLDINFDDLNDFNIYQFPSSTPMDAIENNKTVTRTINEDKVHNNSFQLKTSDKAIKRTHCEIPTEKDSNRDTKTFGDNEEDSDDQMLSQLDVDAIAASYNG